MKNNIITLLEKDIKDYVTNSEYTIDYDFEYNNGRINYDGWKDIYLDSIPCSSDECLLERFGTTDHNLLYDLINANINMFNSIVREVYENYNN